MAFVDEAKFKAMAGDGGNGAVSWHHEPYKPKGGPDGGDGGNGGSVILRADPSVGTLLDIRDHPHVKAGRGQHGMGKRRDGARGEDRVVRVPVGTVVYDEDGVLLADLARPDDEVVAAQGGRGGRGNSKFATATRRAPAFSEKGEPGDQRWLRLELRLLADVGLVGFPNAGKSTLISRISSARPKIADYPFTTLEPNLGVVQAADDSFVVADIPGLIEGAHEGRGLGDRFLRHVRRAAVLCFLVDLAATDRDPVADVDVLRAELEKFDAELAERPYLIVASKMDVAREKLPEVIARYGEVLGISAVTGENIEDLVEVLLREVKAARSATPPPTGFVRHVLREQPMRVERTGDRSWTVTGKRAERAVATTDMQNEEALVRLQRRLISMGVERALVEAGAQEGDEVTISEITFYFLPEGIRAGDETDG